MTLFYNSPDHVNEPPTTSDKPKRTAAAAPPSRTLPCWLIEELKLGARRGLDVARRRQQMEQKKKTLVKNVRTTSRKTPLLTRITPLLADSSGYFSNLVRNADEGAGPKGKSRTSEAKSRKYAGNRWKLPNRTEINAIE